MLGGRCFPRNDEKNPYNLPRIQAMEMWFAWAYEWGFEGPIDAGLLENKSKNSKRPFSLLYSVTGRVLSL